MLKQIVDQFQAAVCSTEMAQNGQRCDQQRS